MSAGTTITYRTWAAAGFREELVPLCGPEHRCSHPGKVPHARAWESRSFKPRAFAAGGNVGLRTRYFPAVDIDIEDPDIADDIERIIFSEVGPTARRTRSNSARRLLLYRLEGEPFKKLKLDGGETGAVEILGNGQQCVIAGTHDTGAVIEWPGGQPVAADLATVGEMEVGALITAIAGALTRLGCTSAVTGRPIATIRHIVTPPTTLDVQIARLALAKLDPDLPHDEWVRVGMALHAKWPDDYGLALWDEWSSHGEKYVPGEPARRWRSFRPGGGIGFGTLLRMAREVRR